MSSKDNKSDKGKPDTEPTSTPASQANAPGQPPSQPEKPTDAADNSPSASPKKKKTLDTLIKEQEAAKKKIAMRKHPAMAARDNRQSKFQGARASRINPFIRILDQHQMHKLRIAKITAIVFLVLSAIAFAIFSIQKWQKDNRKEQFLNKVRKRLTELDKQIQETSGYEKYKTALRAVHIIDANYFVDAPKNYCNWVKRKSGYVTILRESVPEERKNFINPDALIDMVFIPQGRFNIGRKFDDRGDKDERPRHPVMIPYDFWMGRTEITTAQYRIVNPEFRCKRWNNYRLDKSFQPVVRVNWHDAKEYCRILTHWAQKEEKLPKGYEYRLPTEAEWEYACKAGTDTTYYWGETFGNTGAQFANSLDRYSARLFKLKLSKEMAQNDGYRVSSPTGHYNPNAFGLYDMSGNVWEWCYDWYNPKAYSELPHSSPVQLKPVINRLYELRAFDAGKTYYNSTSKIIRGGSWGNQPFDLRSTNRDHQTAETKNTGIGFRIVLSKKIELLEAEEK